MVPVLLLAQSGPRLLEGTNKLLDLHHIVLEGLSGAEVQVPDDLTAELSFLV